MNKRKVLAIKQSKVGRIKNLPGKKITHEQLYNEILDNYLDSGNYIAAISKVHKKYGKAITISQIREACLKISEKAKEICEDIFGEVFFKHSLIYSNISRQFKNLGFSYGENKAMLYRERLLGLSNDEDNEFVINNEFEFIERQTYDINLLNDIQKERLEQLLLKTKGIFIEQAVNNNANNTSKDKF